MRRAVPALASLLPVVALGLAPIPAAAAPSPSPPILSGEVLSGGQPTVQTSCSTTAGTSTISYSSSGVASGPYPGTYMESGSATFTPTPGPLTSFQASFRIESAVGIVTGTKTLTVGSFPGVCSDGPVLAIYRIRAAATYQARITIPRGTGRKHEHGHAYSDSGASSVETQAAGPPGNLTYGSGFLNEYYTSSQTATTRVKDRRKSEEPDQDSDR